MTLSAKFGAFRSWPYGWVLLIAIALLVGGCSQPDTTITGDLPVSPEVAVSMPSAKEMTAGLPRLDGQATVEIKVNGKTVTVQLDGDKAPYTAGNFVDLVEKGVYDGTIFHRVVRSPDPFVVQGGDPLSKDPAVPISQLGTGSYRDENDQERTIPLEILPEGEDEPLYGKTFPEADIEVPPVLTHRKGAIAMARSGVNTASAQFYITLADINFLDGDYAVFGYVTDGMDVVDKIQIEDVIQSITVKAGGENLVQPEGNSAKAEGE